MLLDKCPYVVILDVVNLTYNHTEFRERLLKMADVKSLEHPTLKVPYELLNKKFRAAQKQLDREVSHVQAAAMELERGLHGEAVGASDISRLLGGMVERLQVLKRKAEESISEELEAAYVCKRRLEHLREHAGANGGPTGASTTGAVNLWRRRRLDRMLVEYFLRRGYYGAATRLAHRSDLRDLTNIDVFLVSREVERSLAHRETSKCLAWCHDNRSKLRKLKSTMEFNLRIQEFVELVRADRRMDAVRHARKFFSSFEDDQLQDVQHCMALLAFPTNTELSPYKELLDESRWERLVEQFRQENYRLFQLASQSVFTVALQAGLSALKTPYPLTEKLHNLIFRDASNNEEFLEYLMNKTIDHLFACKDNIKQQITTLVLAFRKVILKQNCILNLDLCFYVPLEHRGHSKMKEDIDKGKMVSQDIIMNISNNELVSVWNSIMLKQMNESSPD